MIQFNAWMGEDARPIFLTHIMPGYLFQNCLGDQEYLGAFLERIWVVLGAHGREWPAAYPA